MKALAIAVALALLTGCASNRVRTAPASKPFPSAFLPTSVAGLQVQQEPSSQQAFAAVGTTSTVSRGELWSLRRGKEVVASLQLAQLKDGLSTREEKVRVGVREAIGNGHYRWFKVDSRQWVGVQARGDLALYLWFPPRRDLFVVAQVSPKQADPQHLVEALLTTTQEAFS